MKLLLSTKTKKETLEGSLREVQKMLWKYGTKKREVLITLDNGETEFFSSIQDASIFLTRKEFENSSVIDLSAEKFFNIETITGA
jgi:hypothetical protein